MLRIIMNCLSNDMDLIRKPTVSVKEWEGEVVFLQEVKKGAADRSYGVQVAKLAGLPDCNKKIKLILEKPRGRPLPRSN